MPNTEITAALVKQFSTSLDDVRAKAHAAALEQHRGVANLSTPLRIAHFLAQAATETGGLKRLIENMNYTKPEKLDSLFSAVHGIDDAKALIARGGQAIANRVYANRNGNGDEASGDGWTFRGRGFLQITGRGNYRKFGKKIGLDLEADPKLLEDPGAAAEASMRYWKTCKINVPADADDVVEVTRLINPALAGLDERRIWLSRARHIWVA